MRRINAGAIGLVVVVLALLVTAPRLAHAFIMADGLSMDAYWEYWLLVVTGVASGLVLTLGNAYLAHVLASHFKRHDALSWVLLSAWVVYLLFAVALIAPALVVGLARSPISTVLYWPLVWAYAVVAALSVEVLVAGSMAGYAIARKAAHDAPHDALDDASAWRIVAEGPAEPVHEVVSVPHTVALDATHINGNGHHAQEDAYPMCPHCKKAYTESTLASHRTWSCDANPNGRRRKGA